MTLTERLTKAQQDRIELEQKRYDKAAARAKKEGREFNPEAEAQTISDDPTVDPYGHDPVVEAAIKKIWTNKKTNG